MNLQGVQFIRSYDWSLTIAGIELYAVSCDFPFASVMNRPADVPLGEFIIPGGMSTRIITFSFYDVAGGRTIGALTDWYELGGGTGKGSVPLRELAKVATLSTEVLMGGGMQFNVWVIPDSILTGSFSQDSSLLTVMGSLAIVGTV